MEYIKYLSPVAVVTLIWAIAQFYQKRKDEKQEKKRKEKFDVYNKVYLIIREIDFEILKLMSNSKILLINVKEDSESVISLTETLRKEMDIVEKQIDIYANKDRIKSEELNELKSNWSKKQK